MLCNKPASMSELVNEHRDKRTNVCAMRRILRASQLTFTRSRDLRSSDGLSLEWTQPLPSEDRFLTLQAAL